MAEPTEQDQAKARELVAARVKAVWSNAFSLGTVKEQADEVDRIALAMAAAREQAVPPKGHVLTDEGTVRKVLGSLPVTADGCVVCVGGLVWMHGDEFGEPTPVSTLVQEVAEDDICYHNAANDDGILSGGREVGREWLSNCYSTRAAAESACKEGK